jgi:hypothetical protein
MSVQNILKPLQWSLGGLLFDAWLRLQHNTSLTITQHPVESGAAITDHSFSNPTRFSFELGVSSCALPVLPSEVGGASRPIRAYNNLLKKQESRELLRLVTKYNTYENILIESMDAIDDYTTQNVLKVNVNCVKVIIVNTKLVLVSASPQITDTTNKGTVTAKPVPDNITDAEAWRDQLIQEAIGPK